MKVFTPDFFSAPMPQWINCSAESANLVDDLIKKKLPQYWSIGNNYFQTDSHEINSSNFKVEARQENVEIVLKRWPSHTDLEKVQYHNLVLDFFNREKIPAPEKLTFSNSQDYCKFGKNFWTLQSFREGHFFDGDLALMTTIVHRVVELQRKLKGLNLEEGSHATEIDFKYNVLREFLSGSRDLNDFFCSEDLDLLKNSWERIATTYQHILTLPVDLNQKSVNHLDLHPHNILVLDQDVTAFLDFDSVKKVNEVATMAYFALKTCKQACIKNPEIEPAVIGSRFLDELCTKSKEYKEHTEWFSTLANAEVLRRLDIILESNVYKKEFRWNKVLPVLLAHLEESDILFSTYHG